MQIGIPNGNASKMRQPDLAFFNDELAVAAHADPVGTSGEFVRGCNVAVSDGELPARRVCVPADQNFIAAEKRKLCVRNGDASDASAGGSADAGAVLTGNGFDRIAVDGDAFAIHTLGIAVRKAADGCTAALGGNGELTASDANVALTADACRTAFSDRMDDAAVDGNAALAVAFIANGGVIVIGRGFYLSAIDGNGHCPGVINSGSADAEALSLGSCLDRAAVDDDAAALIRPDSVSGEHPVRIFSKVVDAPNGGYIAAVDGDRAAISHLACADPYAVHSKRIAFRQGKGFGTDNAAIDGDAAALPEIARRISVGGNVVFIIRSADGGGALLSFGVDIAAVDDDRTLVFIEVVVGSPHAHTGADAGQSSHRPHTLFMIRQFREARRQLAHGCLSGALGVYGEGVALLHVDAPRYREVAVVR